LPRHGELSAAQFDGTSSARNIAIPCEDKSMANDPTVAEQIIAFADLRGYHRQICLRLSPAATFHFLADYYAVAQGALAGSEGRVIKFIGDGLLLTFPASDPQGAIAALQQLKASTDAFLTAGGYNASLGIRAHLGLVAAGWIGEGDLRRFDLAGLAVNETALLPHDEWVLSATLQQRLAT
jgi:class 3 adenylate cyclase